MKARSSWIKKRVTLATLLAWMGMLPVLPAWAYFSGTTPMDGVELKSSPAIDAPTVKILPQGTSFNAADTPVNGFYRVRTATDAGWIEGAAIGRDASSSAASPDATPQAAPQGARKQPQKGRPRKNGRPLRADHPYAVKINLTYNLVSPTDVNNAIGTTDFSNEFTFGAEAFWYFHPEWAAALRIDHFGTSVSGTDPKLNKDLSFSLSSTPIMVGVEHPFVGRVNSRRNDGFYMTGSGFLGLAPTSFSVTNTTDSTAGTYSATPITFLLATEAGYWLTPWISLGGELGYRVLSTSQLTVSGNSTPIPPSLSVKLSGPFIGFSGRFSF